jgi:dTDP-4-amino-4,6-dideoxygalactose transaminase
MKFNEPLHVGAPNIGDRELFNTYVEGMFERHWLTNRGELVVQFEKELAEYLGVKHCISMCNGTVALEIAIRALDMKGEVVLPSLTFVATAHALQWQEITPVFCDVDPVTLCIDPLEVEKHITPKTSGILGVHVYCHPCNVEGLQDVADKHSIKLMFDAAHAFGSSCNGRMIGSFGDCEVFSFHATKFFNSFEGGAVATNNDELAEKIRLMQNFGFLGLDDVGHIGTNGKMTEVCAAMGLTNLRSIDHFLGINNRNYEAYTREVGAIPGLRMIHCCDTGVPDSASAKCNRQYVVIEVMEDFPLSRDGLMQCLHEANVLARRYFWPGCHKMEPYRSLQPNAGMMLPITESYLERLLLLPTGTAVNEEMIAQIAKIIRNNI